MLQVIQDIGDFFQFIVDMFKALFEIIASVVTVLGKCVVFVADIASAVPLWLSIPMGILVLVTVLYKVLGREVQS